MFIITDTEIDASEVLRFKGVTCGGSWTPSTGECKIEIYSDHTEQDCKDNYDTWKDEYNTAQTNKVDHKASARQKLMNGEPLTEEEAKTVVI
jgi:hypothetical protein